MVINTPVNPDPNAAGMLSTNPNARRGPRKTLTGIPCKTGIAWSFDAATGEFLWAKQTVEQEARVTDWLARNAHLPESLRGNADAVHAVDAVKYRRAEGVVDVGELAEPTRTMVSSVIDEQKIQQLPVNGRQFIDFALLAPGVTIGDTTSGSTDVIIEPVTKLSFAGQNIHYNFVAIDGTDNMSTASGIQKTTPSQEAVREFRVINSSYSTEYGRAVGGIVNIITKSGTNLLHGSVYDYFRNDALDARSILASPDLPTCNTPGDPASGGCRFLKKLHQNQYGFTLGGPIKKDRTFFFGNYEGQRRSESPFYNSAILTNISLINGRMTQQQTISFIYFLSAKRVGNLTIPACRLDFKGTVTNLLELAAGGPRLLRWEYAHPLHPAQIRRPLHLPEPTVRLGTDLPPGRPESQPACAS